MSVTFHIPGALREFTGGRTKVEIEASPNVLEEALKALWTRYPGIRDRIATEQGAIRQHINVFVGNEDVRFTGGLTTPIPAGSEISIVAAVSGGRPSPHSPGMTRVSPNQDRFHWQEHHGSDPACTEALSLGLAPAPE